jgi:hypothetical protein
MTPSRNSAWALLSGVLTGFALAIFLGYQVSTYSKPPHFARFQAATSPSGLFYPPFRMLEHLALNRWRPGQTVVIVAGNSVFNGISQPLEALWSRRLQELLGPEKYLVVNLAMVGSHPTEAGVVVAEALVKRGIPVIVCTTAGGAPRPAIGDTHGYYYWEAWAQRALLSYPARDLDLRQWLAKRPEAERRKQEELRRWAVLNSWFYFQELWHHVALTQVFTVWTRTNRMNSWQPRELARDPEIAQPPVEQRFLEDAEVELRSTRQGFANYTELKQGSWHLSDDARFELHNRINAAYAPEFRPHLLVVLTTNAPFYRRRLNAEEREREAVMFRESAAIWQQEGIACLAAVGADFADVDYSDRVHLSSDGGNKVAALVAAEIRRKLEPGSPSP